MGSQVTIKHDFSSAIAGLDKLNGAFKQSLARRMGVEGGVALRDEAKRWVPRSVGPYNPNSRGTQEAYTLRNAIYLAFDKAGSSEDVIRYRVSWNAQKAWWGKLVEFEHYQRYQVYYNAKMGYYTTNKEVPLAAPRRIGPKPFLRPAYDIVEPKLLGIMVARGKEEFALLISEIAQ